MSAPVAIRRQRESGFRLRAGVTPLLAAVLAACAPQPEPRTVIDFMDDGLAREGVLTRCNQNREETLTDEECANARRAAATIALEAERARAPELEQRLRSQAARAARPRARRAQAERMRCAADSAPAFGAPVGTVMPSMSTGRSTSMPTAPSPRPTHARDRAAEPPSNDSRDRLAAARAHGARRSCRGRSSDDTAQQ